MEWIDVFGFCNYKGKTSFVRVIAHKLPACQAAKARKRKTRKASKNQRRLGAERLLSAGWLIVITSLGAEYCGEETLLWLIIWTIAERQSFQAECFLEEKLGISYSAYEECKISFIQVTGGFAPVVESICGSDR